MNTLIKMTIGLVLITTLSGCTISPERLLKRSGEALQTNPRGVVTITTDKQRYDGGAYVDATAYNGLEIAIVFSACNGVITPVLEYQNGATWIEQNSTACLDFSIQAPITVAPGERANFSIPLIRKTLKVGIYRLKLTYRELDDPTPQTAYSNTFRMVSAVPK